jgi:hypothetical protein
VWVYWCAHTHKSNPMTTGDSSNYVATTVPYTRRTIVSPDQLEDAKAVFPTGEFLTGTVENAVFTSRTPLEFLV